MGHEIKMLTQNIILKFIRKVICGELKIIWSYVVVNSWGANIVCVEEDIV
jgi:hypothetical protein